MLNLCKCVQLLRKLISNVNKIEIYDYMYLSRYLIFTCLFIKIILLSLQYL